MTKPSASICLTVFLIVIAHSNAQLNTNEINNLTELFTQFQAQTNQLLRNETFMKSFITTLTKQVDRLPELFSANNSTTQRQSIADLAKPFLGYFSPESFEQFKSLAKNFKSLAGSGGLIGNDLVKKLESSAKRVMAKLLKSETVVDAFKTCMSSGEKIFGKIDFGSVWQRLQDGFADPEARKILEKSLEEFSRLVFS